MKRFSAVFLGLMTVLVTGCPRNEYVLEMKPLGATLERKLTAWREDGKETNGTPKYLEFPKEELALLTARYSKHESTLGGNKHSFIGEFVGHTPDDIGGRGEFTNFVTSVGTGWVYTERFRGNDDLSSRIHQAATAADQLVDLLAGWSRAELSSHPGYESWHRFLTNDFRQDLKNLSLYWWAGSLSSRYKADAENEFITRYAQYLAERDYFRPADLPQVMRASRANDANALMLLVRRLVARKLGILESHSRTGPLAFLADEATATASLKNYLRATESYRLALKQWQTDRKSDSELKEPDPLEIASGLVEKVVELGMGHDTDHLTVKLAIAHTPADTNGKWDGKAGEIVWETDIDERSDARDLPVLCYATWSAPNEDSQKKHFGKTIMNGKRLFEYCLWRHSLDSSEATEWEEFLSGLTSENFKARLEVFRFSAEAKEKPDKEKPMPNLSDVPRQLISEASETNQR